MRRYLLVASTAAAAVAAALLLVPNPAAAGAPAYDGVVRDEGDGLTAAYMVPAGNDNHAATIEKLPDGSLVAAWFAGEHEEASGCAIAVSRLARGSSQWTNFSIVAKRDGYSNQNPLLFFDNTTGILHLWHTQAPANSGESEAELFHLASKDGGKHWKKDTKRYFDAKGVFTRNRIIRRKDGTLLWPYYSTASSANGKDPVFSLSESASVPESGSGWKTYVMDQGKARLEQPTCWRQPHERDTILCYFRDCNQKSIYQATSEDEGKSFSMPEKTKLPNPGSGIEGYPLLNGDIVLMFNPTTDDHRDPLAAGISSDDGQHWIQRNVQDGPTGIPSAGSNEFSYPTVVQTADGLIHSMYSYAPKGQPRTIKYIRFEEDWVRQQ